MSFLLRMASCGLPVLGLALLSPPAAHAESAARPCYDDGHLHPRGSRLPANAPAIVFAPPRLVSERSIREYMLAWRGPDGVAFEWSLHPEGDEYLMKPGHALTPGTHEVSHRDFCSWFTPTATRTMTLTVGPAVPLPTTIGSATQRSPVAEAPYARCLPADVHVVVDVTMTPELQAFKDLTRFRLTYRGKPLPFDTFTGRAVDGLSDYGAVQSSETTLYFGVRDVCAPGQQRVQGTLKIEAHVAGASSDPTPLTIDIDATCPTGKFAPLPVCGPDGGASLNPSDDAGRDGGAADAAPADAAVADGRLEPASADARSSTEDAGSQHASANMPTAPRGSSGCAAGGGRTGWGAPFALLASWWLIRRRRAPS